tara:strand:+ start:247 stop:528 length:282 start_codon:yes stop_codon:yes gene_type:complete
MNKIKLTVAAFLLCGASYAQCTSGITKVENDSITKRFAYVESVNTIEDMIEWMRWDIDNLVIDQEIGQMYIDTMFDLISRLEDINAGYVYLQQ